MQNHQVRNAYLETQVNTATPQKLRQMLIAGAIRFARQTAAHWEADENEQAYESLVRSREIVSELLSTIEPSAGDLPKTMAAIYVFIFRTLTEAQLERDADKLADAIRVLEEEHQTWVELCEKFPDAPVPGMNEKRREITSSSLAAAEPPPIAAPAPEAEETLGGFSIEA